MKFSETHRYSGSVEDVLLARSQTDVREAACKSSGALSWDVQVTPTSQGVEVSIERVMPPNVPAMFRSFIGDSIKVSQSENWTTHPDGSARAEVRVTIGGQPASMIGTSVISSDATGSTERTEGEATVS